MQKFGLTGYPISHSLSPQLFKAAYGEEKFSYSLIETENITSAFSQFSKENYTGINVTMPFKEQIMQYVKHPDEISALLGCANVIINKEGILHSYNTDYDGVKETMGKVLHHTRNDKTLVIGLGGAGKAAALAMCDLGLSVCVTNRNLDKAEAFSAHIKKSNRNISVRGIDNINKLVDEADCIIYTLPIPLINIELLRNKIVLEANYANPSLQPPINSNKYYYISGKQWLYNQAITSFLHFTNCEPDRHKMKQIIGL